jgi:hypothetical protein
MPASRYDIYAEQGTTFKLHMQYKFAGGTGINLSNYTGEIQVRRSIRDDKALLYITKNGVTGGGVTGDFNIGSSGVAGVGGISFNTGLNGESGVTGGILIRVDKTTMSRIPYGKHFYDFELTNPSNETVRLTEGSFEVSREITRI